MVTTEIPDSSVIDSPLPNGGTAVVSTRNETRDHEMMEERTCHAMPCSIDYQGMAASHVYFRPVETDGIVSGTFRGRGMVALAPFEEEGEAKSDENSFLSAALISVQNNQLQIKAEIDRFLEWQHEHNPEVLFFDNVGHTSRVKVAKDWSEVAFALHEPIPVGDTPPQ